MLFEDTYLSIKSPGSAELRERGSKFTGLCFPVKKEEEVRILLQKIRKEHPQANHHCYAYRLSPDPTVFRYSDDREPSGSAGKPILGAIQSKGLTDILVIVVRYFGGTLLGVPGLISAYRSAALLAIENTTVIECTMNERYTIRFPYELMNDVHHFLRCFPIHFIEQEYNDPCRIIFDIRRKLSSELKQKFSEHPKLCYLSTLEPTPSCNS